MRGAVLREKTHPLTTAILVVDIIGQVDAERVENLVDEDTLTDVDVPEVTFDDIGGHKHLKDRLVEQVQQVLSQQDVADDMGVEFGSGILLHGPPGTGKHIERVLRPLAVMGIDVNPDDVEIPRDDDSDE